MLNLFTKKHTNDIIYIVKIKEFGIWKNYLKNLIR